MTERTDTPAAAAPKKTPIENGTTETPPEENREKATEEKEKETPPPKEMRAIVSLKTLKVLNKSEPTLAGEVLIRVNSCSLNFDDLIVQQGSIVSAPKTPFSFECTGEIEEVGEGINDFKVGDQVVTLCSARD